MTQRGYGGPLRYVQGPSVLNDLGRYVAPLGKRALVILDSFIQDTRQPAIETSLSAASVTAVFARFNGESTDAEVTRCTALANGARSCNRHWRWKNP